MPRIVRGPDGMVHSFPDDASDAEISSALEAIPQANAQQSPKAKTWTDTVVDWLPAAGGALGGVVGGIGGTAFGMGVGGVPGAVGGAALGGAAGEAARQLVNELRGQPVPTMGEAATGIAKQAAVQGGAEAAGAGVAKMAAPAMRAAGEAVMQTALKPGIKVAMKAVRAGEVPPVVKTLLDEGINVTPSGIAKLNTIISASNKEIKDAIADVGFEVNPYKVSSRLRQTAQTFSKQVNPAADLDAVSQTGQEFLDTYGGKPIPGQLAQDIKSGTYKQLGQKAYTGELKGASVEAQKALARGLKEEIEDEFSRTLPGIKAKLGLPGGIDLAAANAREGRALDALDAVARRVAQSGNNNPMGLASLAVSHPVTFMATIMDRSPAVKSLIARGLYSSAGYAARVNPQLIRAAVHAIATSPEGDSSPSGSER